MVLPMFAETNPGFSERVYKIFDPQQIFLLCSFGGRYPKIINLFTSVMLLQFASKRCVFECFSISLLEGSCQGMITKCPLKHDQQHIERGCFSRPNSWLPPTFGMFLPTEQEIESISVQSGNLHSLFVLAAREGEWVFILLF